MIKPFSAAYVPIEGKDGKIYTHAVVYGVDEKGEVFIKTRKTDWKPFIGETVENA